MLVVSLDIIEREISELEARDTSYAVCERLSWLYTCRDHLLPQSTHGASRTALTEALSGSEFLEAASGVPYEALMRTLDEYLEAIRLMYPKSYDSLSSKLRELA